MSILFEGRWQRSLDAWCERITRKFLPDDQIELWLFDDAASLHAAQLALTTRGFHVRLYSALKPLVHFFRAQAPMNYEQIRIDYPVSPHAVENRFKLEAYPLAGLLENVLFVPKPVASALDYDITFYFHDDRQETQSVFCPNRLITDWGGQTALTPCGWLRVTRQGKRIADHAITTEFEQLFQETMAAIDAITLPETPPFFEELCIDVSLPFQETRFNADEVLSLQEALHEELYFSALELFQKKAGLASGDRSIQPGQIAPFVRFDPNADCCVQVRAQALHSNDVPVPQQTLENVAAPLAHAQIAALLDAIGGSPLQAYSRAGRAVLARHIQGQHHAVMISACQHGNETTGTVGALQAARVLKDQQEAHFVISPLENPDGNALFLRLLQDNPQHMHHAARYTAYGNDLQYTPDHAPAERQIRVLGQACSGAALHLNLHGYPSHEWIRPLSGYIPRNFAMWTLPKGFFLVFRYHSHLAQLARALAEQVTQKLAQIPALVQLNRQQIALYRQHAGDLAFDLINDVACSFQPCPEAKFALEMVTEFPDETIAGAAFRLGVLAQKTSVLAAYSAWQNLYPGHHINPR